MTSLFISYSRKDTNFAKKLTDCFKDQDFDFWIDWKSIPPTVDFWKQIEDGIEKAGVFLFLMSPDSIKSEVCKKEIAHAVQNGKRLIPLVIRDIQDTEAPSSLAKLNWIFAREQDDFEAAFAKILVAIRTDYDWVQTHRDLQVNALKWERSGHEDSILLRGKELQDAELQLATNTSKEPYPTDLQREYVLRSRQATDRQRRTTTSIAIIGGIALAVLAVIAFVQAGLANEQKNIALTAQSNAENESIARATSQAKAEANQKLAEEQAIISRAGELAAESAALSDRNFQLSLLLGVEAFNTSDTVQTRGTLMNNVRANAQLQMYLGGPTSDGFCIAFSSNGKMLAWGDGSGSISLWDVEANRLIGQLLSGNASTIAFSPDGKMLASGIGRTIILWDIATGKPIHPPLTGHTSTVQRVAFSPDGKTLASGSSSGDSAYTIILWDVKTGKPKASVLNGNPNQYDYVSPEVTLSFSPDGLTLAAASSNGSTIDLWDVSTALHSSVESGLTIKQSLAAQGMGIESISFSTDEKHLISVGSGGPTIWDLETGQAIEKSRNQLLSIFGSGYSYAFSPDRKILASADFEGSINLWNVEANRLIGRLSSGANNTTSLAFSPDGNTLASGSRDSPVILWNVSNITDEPIGWPLYTDGNRLANLALAPHGEMLASGDYDGSIILWDIKTGQSIRQLLNGPTELIRSLVFSPDGKYLASASDNTARVWEAATGQEKARMTHDDGVTSVAFSPDGKYAVSGSDDNTARVWEAATGQEVARITHENAVNSAVFSPDGKYVVSGSEDHTARVWEATTGQEVARMIQDDAVNSVVFSPDGKYVVSVGLNSAHVWEAMTGKEIAHMAGNVYSAFDLDTNTLAISSGNTVMLWELDTEKPIGQPLGQLPDEVTSLAFSPDGKTLASSINNSTIVLWDVRTRQPIGSPLFWEDGSVGGVAFSSDGKTLAAINDDNHIVLWDLDPRSWIQKICQRVGRNFTVAEWNLYFPNEERRITCPQWP